MSQRKVVSGMGQERAAVTALSMLSICVLLAACQQSASQRINPKNNVILSHKLRVGQPKPAAQATSCPATNFRDFLKKFASDKTIQFSYTLPLVAVTDYVDPAGGGGDSEATITKQVPREKYRDFTLKYERGAFHNVDSTGDVDSAPENVKIETKGPSYFVHYIYGMSEGNSWLFEPKDGCWFLSEDPEPPME